MCACVSVYDHAYECDLVYVCACMSDREEKVMVLVVVVGREVIPPHTP